MLTVLRGREILHPALADNASPGLAAGGVAVLFGASYGAGKGGAIAFMRHLAIENARDGVTANTVALGLMQPPTSVQFSKSFSVLFGRNSDLLDKCPA